MTEKRFTFNKDTVAINLKTPIVYNNEKMSIGEVLEMLNNLYDESEQLKGTVDDLSNDFMNLMKEKDLLEKLLECSREEANDYCEELMGKDEFIRLYKRQIDEVIEENEKLKSVNQELRNELKFDEEMYKTFKEIIDEADDLITSHLSKHYQRQWKNFCKHRGVLDD